ncbi:MAG: DinB family protein [Bryobacteraceae bacterium]|nr:DinB family protein [Bryobacteraceae bacterium]
MTAAPEILRFQIDSMIWATARVLDAAAQLTADELARDFATAHRSVIGTLAHIFFADRVWLRRIRGEAPGAGPEQGLPGLPVLRESWAAVHREWQEWASALGPADASAVLSYTDLRGTAWQTPLWQVVLHVVNHGTHHRGQVTGFLRAMGRTPPPLDLIAYCRGL